MHSVNITRLRLRSMVGALVAQMRLRDRLLTFDEMVQICEAVLHEPGEAGPLVRRLLVTDNPDEEWTREALFAVTKSVCPAKATQRDPHAPVLAAHAFEESCVGGPKDVPGGNTTSICLPVNNSSSTNRQSRPSGSGANANLNQISRTYRRNW